MRLRYSAAACWLAGAAWTGAAAQSSTAPAVAIDAAKWQQLQAALAAAETNAAKANAEVAEVKRLLATFASPAPATAPVPAAETPILKAACPNNAADIKDEEYFRLAEECQNRILAGSKISKFRIGSTTGVGTTIAAASTGAAATFTFEHVSPEREVFETQIGENAPGLVQRVWRHRYGFGFRADIAKDDKSLATIGTFGELDRLTSKVALFARYGQDYSSLEPFARFTEGGTYDSSFVKERAAEASVKLTLDCLKSGQTNCTGLDLVRWIFKEKPKERDFANAEAVKLYNSVFWGPPPVDSRPLWGWSIRGEISRPTFDYYPFTLTQAPDPFKPGKTKTSIDPALFPADFASNITKDADRINFGITGRIFYHLSPFRAKNVAKYIHDLNSFATRTSGTTVIATASYVRQDEIETPFRDVQICPTPVAGQVFVTSQNCTTVNIAAPVRKNSFVLGGEVRQGIEPFWLFPPTMLSAKLTHNFKTDENGLVVPLYFGADAAGLFTGGLRAAHRWGGKNEDGSSKKAETVFGIVVGVSLGVDGTTGID